MFTPSGQPDQHENSSFLMRSVDMQTRQRCVGLIAQNTRVPNIFDYISSRTRVWAQKDCIELLDGSILSFTALPGELCADAATFSALFVRLQNIILVYEAIVKNLCMDL